MTTAQERGQAKATRLMILGAMTELEPEEQAAYREAKAAVDKVLADYGDMGKMALVVSNCELVENDNG